MEIYIIINKSGNENAFDREFLLKKILFIVFRNFDSQLRVIRIGI